MKFAGGGFLSGGATVAASISIVRAPAGAALYEFKHAAANAPDHPQSIRIGQMWSAIAKESGGRVNTQFFPNSVLGGDSAMLVQLRTGAIQFLNTYPGNIESVVSSAGILDLGFIFKNDAVAFHAVHGPIGEYIRKELGGRADLRG
jgi:TRAP-type C4-dicarboxylate transport system substrate-binding protein